MIRYISFMRNEFGGFNDNGGIWVILAIVSLLLAAYGIYLNFKTNNLKYFVSVLLTGAVALLAWLVIFFGIGAFDFIYTRGIALSRICWFIQKNNPR